jgi:hypothetical protein
MTRIIPATSVLGAFHLSLPILLRLAARPPSHVLTTPRWVCRWFFAGSLRVDSVLVQANSGHIAGNCMTADPMSSRCLLFMLLGTGVTRYQACASLSLCLQKQWSKCHLMQPMSSFVAKRLKKGRSKPFTAECGACRDRKKGKRQQRRDQATAKGLQHCSRCGYDLSPSQFQSARYYTCKRCCSLNGNASNAAEVGLPSLRFGMPPSSRLLHSPSGLLGSS